MQKDKRKNLIKMLIGVLFIAGFFVTDSKTNAANYTLDITNINEVGANNRIKYAYPGIEYNVRIAAAGGQYPFTWSLATAPSGMTIDSSSGIITWSNPTETGSPHTVTVRVTDNEGNIDTESYTLTVTNSTDRFIFVATADDGTPTGSITDPYSNISQFWSGSNGTKIVYFRAGTHIISGGYKMGMRQNSARIRLTSNTPKIFLAYPGEDAIINEEYDAGWSETCTDTTAQEDCQAYHFDIYDQNDAYFGGLKFDNIGQYGLAITAGGDYATFYNLEFRNVYTSGTESNQAYINYMSGGYAYNHLIANCTFGSASWLHPTSYFANVKLYQTRNTVIEDNYFYGNYSSAAVDGLSIKCDTFNIFTRHNHFVGSGGLYGQGYATVLFGDAGGGDIEMNYNYFENSYPKLDYSNGTTVGIVYIEHNTIVGIPIWRNMESTHGPVYLNDNVIQNTSADSGNTTDTGYYRYRTYFRYCEDSYSIFNFSNNLVGDSGLVDSNGLLVNRSYVGTYGWEIPSDDTISPAAPGGLAVN